MTRTATTYRGHTGWVHSLAWSPDGHYIASGGADNTVQVWEALTGEHVTTYHGHDSGVLGVAWSPTQPLIASVAWDGDGAHIWEADTGRRVRWCREAVTLENALAWSPSGRFLAVGGYRVAHVWDVGEAVPVVEFAGRTGFTRGPERLAWSPDERRLAVADAGGHVYVRELDTGRRGLRYRAHDGYISGLAYSPDGRSIASTGPGAACQVRDAATGDMITLYRGHPTGPRLSDWWPSPRKPTSRRVVYPCRAWDVAWSPDGRYLASASGCMLRQRVEPRPEYDAVHVWVAATGRRAATYHGHADQVFAVAWSPDGASLASCSADGTVQVWQVPEGMAGLMGALPRYGPGRVWASGSGPGDPPAGRRERR